MQRTAQISTPSHSRLFDITRELDQRISQEIPKAEGLIIV